LISGGFRQLASRAQSDFDIRHSFAACDYEFQNGQLTSYNLLPCDFEGKLGFVQLMLRAYRFDHDDWVFVGDGANDVPIAERAPLSIGFQAHDSLRNVATVCVESFSEITSVLGNLSRSGGSD